MVSSVGGKEKTKTKVLLNLTDGGGFN